MSKQTSIEWTELSWNPTTGCTKVSPGCENCYAETMAHRLKAMGLKGYENGFTLTLQPDRLKEPLSRRKSSMYFVNSMSDLFHQDVPDQYIKKVVSVISKANFHQESLQPQLICRSLQKALVDFQITWIYPFLK